MEKVKWIIEKHLFTEYENKLAEAVEAQGGEVHFFDELKNESVGLFLKKFNENDIVVSHTSIEFARKSMRTSIFPNYYLTFENYQCYKYYGYFGDWLLNSDYRLLPLNDIIRNYKKIFSDFKCENIFIRPSDGEKSFAGQTLKYDNFEQEFNILLNSYGGLDENSLVLVAPVKAIEKEWRFIVIDGKVISGSLYMEYPHLGNKPRFDLPCIDLEALLFAQMMVGLYQPDKVYTIDVCKTMSGEYKLLELNSFHCANMYGNDYGDVVREINKVAINEYNDIFN